MQIPESVGRHVARYLNSLDLDGVDHITKIDPEKVEAAGGLTDTQLDYLQQSDAVMTSGSDGVTAQNTSDVVEQLENLGLPVIQEPYAPEHVSDEVLKQVDYEAIPAVWNAGDTEWIMERHEQFFGEEMPQKREAARQEGERMVEDLLSPVPAPGFLTGFGRGYADGKVDAKVVKQAYVVQNPDCEVADLTDVEETRDPEQVGNIANTINEFYDNFDIMYIEYSGTFGDPEDVRQASERLEDGKSLLYGGGISSRQEAERMLEAGADAIVVGDVFHRDPESYLETIPDQSSSGIS